VVHLSVHQNTKTNKKKYVFCYPNDNKWLRNWHWRNINRKEM
jgi:pyoverdine/dityrosine biosynthesis protein Dit1